MESLKCKYCGKELKKGLKSFCNRECSSKFQNKQVTKICLECGKEFVVGLNRANAAKYCSYECKGKAKIKETHEIRICKVCGKEFNEYKNKKREICSDNCRKEWNAKSENKIARLAATEQGIIKKYGVKRVTMLPQFKDKVNNTKRVKYGDKLEQIVKKGKKTKLENHGNENYNNIEQGRKTKLENHGDENYNNRPKFNETMQELYGVDWAMQSEELRQRAINTWLIKYDANNPMQNANVILSVKNTKDIKYGDSGYNNFNKTRKTKKLKYNDEYYNNSKKTQQTLMNLYGVNNAFLIRNVKSNGILISKPQKRVYEAALSAYKSALLEEFLKDVMHSVDIYIPELHTIIEVYGDYWHCNPKMFDSTYYHSQLHMTAQERWDSDAIRIKKFTDSGYKVIVLWERDIKRYKKKGALVEYIKKML